MKDFFKTPIPYLVIIWIIMLSGYLIYLVNDGVKGDITITNELTELCEQAYFEGQRDALENNIRIKRNQDSCWIWISSPWNSGKEPVFDPSFNCR